MECKIMELVGRITVLAAKISAQTEADVFAYYSGHVNLYNIYWHKKGWEDGMARDVSYDIWLNRENAYDKLEQVYNQLVELYQEKTKHNHVTAVIHKIKADIADLETQLAAVCQI